MSCDISVIIPSYNSSDKIPRCLAALDEQQTGASFEIIVVDSSEDGTGETLERREEIRLIRSEGRVFPGTARNRGAGAASGLILAFVDADCIPSPQWVQRIWEARPDLSNTLVGGCVANGTPESSIGSAEYFSELSALLPGSPQREVDFLPAANISVGASQFREVGGFKDYEKGSDVTLGKDCREKGIQPVFHPEIVVAHINRTDFNGFARNQERLGWGAGNNRVLYDLPGSWLAKFPPGWPLVPAVRFTRIAYRSFRDGSGQRVQVLKALPFIFLGTLFFGYGFARGALEARRALSSVSAG